MEILANRPEIFIPLTLFMMGMVVFVGIWGTEPSKPSAKKLKSSKK